MDEGEVSDDDMEYDSDGGSICLQTEKIACPQSSLHQINLSEESTELLLWRLEKDESFSDWNIEVSVTNESTNKKTAYHVHKTTLAFGPKKSRYFEALLKSGQFSESSDNTSMIELPEDIAQYFSDFLDYMYAPLPSDCNHIIKRDNRQALLYLAKYFLVQKLTEDVYNFIEKDIQHNLEHVEEYITEFGSGESGEEDTMPAVLVIVTRVCSENILHIGKDSSLLTSLTPAMLLHIVSMARTNTDFLALSDDKKDHICRLAINYIKHHHGSLNAGYCKALISELYFPDDTTLAGLVAIDILVVVKEAGWEKDIAGRKYNRAATMCIAATSRYLSDNAETVDLDQITEKLPFEVVCILLKETFNRAHSKNTHKKDGFDVTCELWHTKFTPDPIGKTAKISVKPTDTINYILYLASRRLNVLVNEVFCEDMRFGDYQLVCDTDISSNTVLKVTLCCY